MNLKEKLHKIIFEADTKKGKWFDIILLWIILFSIVLLMLESVSKYNEQYSKAFYALEWIVTILFTIEYILRIYAVKKPWKYIFSFYGIIDFLSTIPLYLSMFILEGKFLLVLRTIRLLRVFRILNLHQYTLAGNDLGNALKKSKSKIIVFIGIILSLTIILGTVMYLIEGEQNGFTSIPRSMYWAIVTMTTVGYGDIAPHTAFGQFIASVIMILGYGIIAIPTGIVTTEMMSPKDHATNTSVCRNCMANDHRDHAKHCYNCGEGL